MSNTTPVKLDEGMEIVLDVERVDEAPTTQHAGHDYKVTGLIGPDERICFFVGGSAMDRQCGRLGVAPADLAGYLVLFRRKKGKRGNGAAVTFTDVEWAPQDAQLGIRRIGGGPTTAPAAPAAPARQTPPPSTGRGRARGGGQPGPHSFGPPLPNEVDDSPYSPPPEPPPAPASATDLREDRFKKAAASAYRNYSTAFAAARKVAKEHEDLTFDAHTLHAMASTIAIEIGKQVRGDKY